MLISIDGRPMEESLISGDNLEDILSDLTENHMPPNKIVGEVLLNGRTYTEDLPHAAVEVPRTDIESLVLVTLSSEDIARHFLDNGQNILGSMLDSLPKITELFRLGDETEANEHYLRFLESLHLTVSLLEKVIQVMDIPYDVSIGELGSIEGRLGWLAEITTQLLRIQEENDWIYLADVLEYELTPELETLRDMLPDMKSRIH